MDILEELKEYFRNNTKEKILEDWEKSKKYDEVGITVDEFLKLQPKKPIDYISTDELNKRKPLA